MPKNVSAGEIENVTRNIERLEGLLEEWVSARAMRRESSCRLANEENKRTMIIEQNASINTAETNIGGKGSHVMRENIPIEEGVHPDTFQSVEHEANGTREEHEDTPSVT